MPVVGLAALAIRFPFPLLVVLCSALWTSAFIQPQSRWPYISVASLRPQALNMLKVALTRENGANDKLWQLLHPKVNCYEIPCIMFDKGADVEQLGEAILEYDVVVITSPQGAKVFLESWRQAGSPSPLKVVTVGKGTSKPLMEAGIEPVFEPSDSTAATLAQELPRYLGESVLYAASALADNRLVEGLLGRGFSQVCSSPSYISLSRQKALMIRLDIFDRNISFLTLLLFALHSYKCM